MADWEEYKSSAKKRGSLALELYVVESTPEKSPKEIKEVLPAHLSYQQTLEVAGALAFAGPLSDMSGDLMQGSGLIVYRAKSMSDARQLAEADPMHESGARSFTLRKWLINEGSLSLNVGLSTNNVSLI
jgi:uncharacterized protein YciI